MKPRASSDYKTCIVGEVSKDEVGHYLAANRPFCEQFEGHYFRTQFSNRCN
jgi:hypothetical protein